MKKAVYFKSDDEHSMAQSLVVKNTPRLRLRKLLMILGYILYVGLWVLAVGFFQTFVVYLMTFSVLTLCLLIFLTWRYTQPEYEIAIDRGTFLLAVIWGGVKRTELFSCRVTEIESVRSYREACGEGGEPTGKNVYRVLLGEAGEETVVAAAKPAGKPETVLIFNAGERMRKLLRYYHSKAFESPKV